MITHTDSHKILVKKHFQSSYSKLAYWQEKNRYYYSNIQSLYQFLVPENQRILEIGSGTGSLLNSLKPAYGVGIDIVEKLCEHAQERFPSLRFKAEDVEKLESNETFDYIILSDTISWLEDIQKACQQIRSACTSSTRLVISFYNPGWKPILKLATLLKQRMPLAPLNWLSYGDISNILNLSGFEVIKHDKKLLIPRRIPLLSSFVNRFIAPLPVINQLCLIEYIVARPVPNESEARDNLKQKTCSVIVPARNEAGNIEGCVTRLPQMGAHTEIIFVEGHSQDNTWSEIQRVQAEYSKTYDIKAIQQTKKGKGNAVREAFAIATGDILIILDSDLTVRPENLPHFFEALASSRCEFANGCRLIYPCSKRAMPLLNVSANRFFAFLLSYLIDNRIKDSLCGTKAISSINYQKIADNRKYFGDFDPFGDLIYYLAHLSLIYILPIFLYVTIQEATVNRIFNTLKKDYCFYICAFTLLGK